MPIRWPTIFFGRARLLPSRLVFRQAFGIAAWCLIATPVMAQPIFGGYVEAVHAMRVEQDDALYGQHFFDWEFPRSELRAQFSLREIKDRGYFFVNIDARREVRQIYPQTSIDLREGYIGVKMTSKFDLKVGRQVATWGTGDLIFVNDLFAKDWEAFFTGLDDAYLKLPQELVRVTLSEPALTIDAALSPRFTPDHLSEEGRISIYDPSTGFLQQRLYAHFPDQLCQGFARVSGSIGASEWALYGYWGHWPVPAGMRVDEGYPQYRTLYYPELATVGASGRFPTGQFLNHAEIAYYASLDNPGGDDPLIANSQIRGFVGTDKSLGHEWTVGAQYYAEWMFDYDLYRAGVPAGFPVFDELRSTVTLRIEKLAAHQNLHLSAFGFWGITDQDYHLRPSVSYKITDAVGWTVGASVVGGNKPYTTFGQFRHNSNVFTRLRYSF